LQPFAVLSLLSRFRAGSAPVDGATGPSVNSTAPDFGAGFFYDFALFVTIFWLLCTVKVQFLFFVTGAQADIRGYHADDSF